MSAPTTVEVTNLGKRFERRWVFRRLQFALQSGDALLVIGRNGAGKSTLLRLIAGLVAPTEGQIALRGDLPVTPDDRRRFVGLSSPELALYGALTAIEHLQFFASVRGERWSRSMAVSLLDEIGLEQRGNDLISGYSTGMKQRLRLAVATMHRPSLLLLDEPGAGLDDAGRAVLTRLVAEQRQRGTLILATNDPDEHHYGELSLELGA